MLTAVQFLPSFGPFKVRAVTLTNPNQPLRHQNWFLLSYKILLLHLDPFNFRDFSKILKKFWLRR